MKTRTGVVLAIAIRTGNGAPMLEISECRATPGRGLDGDDRARGKRGVTLLDLERWLEAVEDLSMILPWHARRANVLIDGLDLTTTIGKHLRIGQVELRIWGETKPCIEMEAICPGLRKALSTRTRGGVYGEVVVPGLVRIGDTVRPPTKSGV